MNERLTIQDLTDLLASRHSMTKRDAETFVKEFFLLIEEALENEKYVKIKGLGTFKLIEVDNRESVNVNTGERFQIKGHTKVSFTPDTNLRDTINKPFAHFDTVVLNDNTVLEDTPEEDIDGEDDEIVEGIPVQIVEVEVETESEVVESVISEEKESKDTAGKVQEELFSEEIVEDLAIQLPVTVTEESKVEESVAQNEKEIGEEVEVPVIKQWSEPINNKAEFTAEQIIAQELQKANLKPEVVKKVQPEVPESNAPKKENNFKKEKSPIPYLVTIIVVVLLLCGGAITFIYYPDLFSSSANEEILDMPVAIQPAVQLMDTIAKKDTINTTPIVNKKIEVQPKTVVKKEDISTVPVKQDIKEKQPQTSTSVYSDSAVYKITGTKGTHTIANGETLTKVSLRYYGTKALWPYIVKHNQGVIKNPDNVPYGTTIKIPELTKK